MGKFDSEYDPHIGDQDADQFATDSIFSRKVKQSRISRERFKENRQKQRFYKKAKEDLADRESEELEQIALTDKLTGLGNDRAFQLKFLYELRRARRYKRPLSLMLLAIDRPEEIRKQYGTPCIDECMQALARIVTGLIRDLDHAARTNFDQIAIIFPETNCSPALQVGERIREILSQTPIRQDIRKLRITASIGLVTFPSHGRDEIDLLQMARGFLNKAKKAGGNKLVASE